MIRDCCRAASGPASDGERGNRGAFHFPARTFTHGRICSAGVHETLGKEFDRYDRYLSVHALQRLEACVGFISGIDLVDAAIVGVGSSEELQGILDAINRAKTMKLNGAELAVQDEDLLNPARWGKA